jgi:hypothetical protein
MPGLAQAIDMTNTIVPITLLLFALYLSACATKLRDRDGRTIATIQGDATNITIHTPDMDFHADTLSHSGPTKANYSGATSVIGGAGAAVTSAILAKP